MDYLHITLSSHFFVRAGDCEHQSVSISAHLTGSELMQEISQHFKLDENNLALYRRVSRQLIMIDLSRTLADQGVADGVNIILQPRLMRLPPGLQPTGLHPAAHLEHLATGNRFYIEWQPWLIGRSEAVIPATMEYLGLDTRLITGNDRRISRQHVRITVVGATYQIESLRPDNLAYLNNELIPVATPIQLNENDLIAVREISLRFHNTDRGQHTQ